MCSHNTQELLPRRECSSMRLSPKTLARRWGSQDECCNALHKSSEQELRGEFMFANNKAKCLVSSWRRNQLFWKTEGRPVMLEMRARGKVTELEKWGQASQHPVGQPCQGLGSALKEEWKTCFVEGRFGRAATRKGRLVICFGSVTFGEPFLQSILFF